MNPPNEAPTQPEDKRKNLQSKWELVGFALEFGFIIALPLLIFIKLGQYFDTKWGTEPWLALLGIILAMTITTIWIAQRLKPFIAK